MGVVSISSSVARTPLGLKARFVNQKCKRPLIVAFKSDKSDSSGLSAPNEKIPLPIETPKKKKGVGKGSKSVKRVKAVSTDDVSACTEVDYNEAAARLESIYKLSLPSKVSDLEDLNGVVRRGRRRRKRSGDGDGREGDGRVVVRNVVNKRPKRLSLDKRVELKKHKVDELVDTIQKRKNAEDEKEKIDELVRQYSSSTDLASLDWKKMKIPPVLSSTEHSWLFKLMQPMKVLVQVKEHLAKDMGREPTHVELAGATNMSAFQVRRCLEVGRAARNKLIKHNLRLVLFVMNKYFQDFANCPKFQDLCQAGVKGLITAIDRFEPKRKFRLSTYGLFWIRHAIIRSMTVSSFTRVPFGLESVRTEIQKAKLELLFEHQRLPTEEEIIEKVGITPERYREVMKASKPVSSLHSKHSVTQEEFINAITDDDGVGGDDQRQPALLRLALDDVLDSLKPKESLVIRQRYGLDGKGDRTLGEIASNLNISREMVRKHEVKALMKLKHPTRVEYLRQHLA